MRAIYEVERIYHNSADAAAKHDDVLLFESPESHRIEPVHKDLQRKEDEDVDNGWVYNQRNELCFRVDCHVFVTWGGNQNDYYDPDGQPNEVVVDLQSLHKFQRIEREYTNVGLTNEIPTAA